MTVYVDDMLLPADVPNGKRIVSGRWSHLMADTREELDEFADRLGLSRSWIQHPGTYKEHYDVTRNRRDLAIKLGAVKIGYLSTEFVALMNRKRQTLGQELIGAGQVNAPGLETETLF